LTLLGAFFPTGPSDTGTTVWINPGYLSGLDSCLVMVVLPVLLVVLQVLTVVLTVVLQVLLIVLLVLPDILPIILPVLLDSMVLPSCKSFQLSC
jgi:hypothetical protein